MVERLTREREQVLKTLDTRIDDYRARQADAAARLSSCLIRDKQRS